MIKIIFLAANPLDTERLRLDEEVRAIDNALRLAEFRNTFELHSHWAVRIDELQGLFLRYQPHIVHFSGHGTDASEIILQDDAGQAFVVSSNALSDLFNIFKKQVRCVLLNACYSEDQAIGIGEHVDSVIGMSDEITDKASIQFATAFYRGIGYGQDVQTAFDLGCNQIGLSGINDADKPQLLGKANPTDVRFTIDKIKEGNLEMNQSKMSDQPWWEQLREVASKMEASERQGNVTTTTITIGDGAHSNIVGDNNQQTITNMLGEPKPDDKEIIKSQFTKVQSELAKLQETIDDTLLQVANMQLKLLEGELTKTEEGQKPSENTITMVGDWLLDNIPAIAEALTNLFATPAVGKVVGKAGDKAIEWIKRRF